MHNPVRSIAIVAAFFALCSIGFLIPGRIVHAQTSSLTAAQQAQLQAQLKEVEAEELEANKQLQAAQSQSASLSRDIAVLDAKIKAAQLDIKAKNLLIQTLGTDIANKQGHIDDLETRIAKGKQTLATLMRKTSESDAYSLPEVILAQSSISDFFTDIDSFQEVEDGLKSTFEQLRSDEASTSAEKDALTARQNAAQDARHAIQVQQANIQSDEAQQKKLLAISKGHEASYSALAAQKSAQAAQIRAALFQLAGGSKAIPFGTALTYAQKASAKTGVDPAFLLAILKQESNLGANVGRCYLSDQNTGAGIYVSTGAAVAKVMNPTRDVPPFISLTKSLGMDPYQSIVSCQLDGIGWGGAMGPAQFIASTWDLISDQVATLLGISSLPNPWNPEHAIMAEAIFMENLGASAGSYTSELNSACRYFSGSKCPTGSKLTAAQKQILGYGQNVMALADSIQRNQIDPLQGL